MNRVLQYYKEHVVKQLTEKFGYTTVMQVPKIEKIVLNMGIGDSISNSKLLEAAVNEAKATKGKPTAVIMKSVKGKGVSYMENQAGWHGAAPNEEQYNQAIAELDAKIAELEASL